MNYLISIIRKIQSGEERSVTVKKNVLASFALKGISMAVSFALVPLTIDYVSSELYGVWLTLSSILVWLGFMDIGFTQGLKNKLTEAIANGEWDRGQSMVSTTYVMMSFIFIPICVIFEFLLPFVNWTSLLNVSAGHEEEIRLVMHVMIAFACLQMIVNVITSVAASFQKVALSNSFLVIGNISSLVIILIIKEICPPSLLVLAFSLAAMPILVAIIGSIILYHGDFKRIAPSFSKVDFKYVKELIGLGCKFFIINIQAIVLYQSTNVLISYVSSPDEVTNYNIAYKLLSCAMMAFTIITAPLWPAYTDAYVRGDFQWMKRTRSKMIKILYYSILSCVILALLAQPIYSVWIGNNVHIPYEMTFLVAFYVVVFCWITLNGTLIVGIGKIRLNAIVVTFGMIVHIPISLMLSKYLGCYGVLTSMIIVNMIYGVLYHIQANKLLNNTAQGIWNQ